MSKSFAENLKQLRQQKGFTQEQVANQLHITYQAVSKWETGGGYPDLSLIVPLAQLLSVSTDTLLGAFEQQDLSRQEELIKELKKITNWNKDGRAQKLEIARTLIREFPNTPDANYWYACCVYDYLEYDVPEEEKKHYLLLAEKHFRVARESAEYQNASTVSFVTILSHLGKKEEAIALSQKQTGETKRKCMAACLNKEQRE